MSVTWASLCIAPVFADQEADEAAIRHAVEAYVTAYNSGDAKSLASLWSPEAVYSKPGTQEQVVGREAIEQEFSSIFGENNESKLVVDSKWIQFMSPTVALESGIARLTRPDQTAEETEYSAVYVKRDDDWLLDRVTEKLTPSMGPNYEHLKELDWLIGTWVDEDNDARVETKYAWTANRNFISQMYSLSIGDQIEHSGLQVIGWDPTSRRIRSWTFDSDGGYGEGRWKKSGKVWHIINLGTLPDGTKSSSSNIIKYVDDDTFTWQSVSRMCDNELLPNVDEVVVVRQKDSAAETE
ncbi:SgcJ/EcaC family oxidoreductase [Roseiconus nitratireducens]|uniref:SgcJ/EcaC family oxidoreductase n=2 Tax=Roseiconus nitratireducens TaxID=2605748 RepID=A0A5M6CTW7_9BACT|nr:SgcJ/EcaC family oxidoreductase [Roseiconus nitratireducens]